MKFYPYLVSQTIPKGDADELAFWWKDRLDWLANHVLKGHSVCHVTDAFEVFPNWVDEPFDMGPRFGQTVLITFQDSDEATRFKLTFG
jgi:hypothetical protein